MSEVNNVLQTRNQLITNYDISKLLLGFNHFTSGNLTASGADVVIQQGQLMGRIAASQLLVPLDSGASDGSQFPVGIAIVGQTIVDGTTGELTLVNKGKIASDKIVFSGTDTLDTVVGDKSLRDHLNDLGLILEDSVELTNYDNQ